MRNAKDAQAGPRARGETGARTGSRACAGGDTGDQTSARGEARAEKADGDQPRIDRIVRVQQGGADRAGEKQARLRSDRQAQGIRPGALYQREWTCRPARLGAVQPAPVREARRRGACLPGLQGHRCLAGRDLRFRQDHAREILPRSEGARGPDRVPRADPAWRGEIPGHAGIGTGFVVLRGWLVRVEPAGRVLTDHAVAVRDGNIEGVLPAGEARQRFPGYEQVDLPEHVLIPGLVNAHTHAAMTLMRGLADDLPLMRWLEEHIWPAEKRHVSAQFVRDGTLAACAEMLRGGITCFNDMYFFPDAALESALEAGMRSVHGIIVIEFPSAYAADAADYLRKGLEVRDRYRDERLASFCIAPHAPYTVADASLRQVAVLAAELDLPVPMHVHETEHEIQASLSEHGVRPLERLRRLNLLGPNLIAVHAVHLNAEEIALLAHHPASVVHCPSSNLKLASGFAPVAKLAKAGLNIALGTDGAASNNRLDMFQEMRTAALLANAVPRHAQPMPAHDLPRAPTLAAAHALVLGERIGSSRAGKAADLAAVALRGPALAPLYDARSHLVYPACRRHFTPVSIDRPL